MTPTTKAGRALLAAMRSGVAALFSFEQGDETDDAIPAAILAIEREAAAEAEALRAALEGLVEAIDYTRKTRHLRHPVSCYCSVNAALEDARAALATPAPAAPAYCANCGYRVTDDPGSCLRPDNHTAPAAPADSCHPHIPTLCATCGHAIEATR